MARATAALSSFDRGRVTAAALLQLLVSAAGPRALVAAIDLGAPYLVEAKVAATWQVC